MKRIKRSERSSSILIRIWNRLRQRYKGTLERSKPGKRKRPLSNNKREKLKGRAKVSRMLVKVKKKRTNQLSLKVNTKKMERNSDQTPIQGDEIIHSRFYQIKLSIILNCMYLCFLRIFRFLK
jgi:hypothetical protein